MLLSLKAVANNDIVINHMSDVTHIEIPGLGANEYEINKNNKTLVLKINSLSEESRKAFLSYKDKHILGISVQKSPSLDQELVTIQLSSADIEMFDYLTDSPSSLSIDLYYDDEKKNIVDKKLDSTNKSSTANIAASKNQKSSSKNDSLVEAARELASDEFIKTIEASSLLDDLNPASDKVNVKFDPKKSKNVKTYATKDPLDFDIEKINFPIDILIEARDKVFLRFPLLLNESEYLVDIVKRPVSYEIKEKEDAETKDFLKAKKMFDKKDYKSFFKSRKILGKKYPKSKYTEIISFMYADALMQAYSRDKEKILLDEALLMYDALAANYPASNLTERTYLMLAYLRMKENKFIEATKTLKTYIELYKTSPLRENIKLILAQALMRTRQYKDAGIVYQALLESSSKEVREIAYFDMGDAFLEKKDYKNAIKYYQSALATYPKEAVKYPNVHFNLAESLFMSEDYKKSLDHYRLFLQKHPQHAFASYAWTRLGEIMEIANLDQKVWKGLYNESVFRFNNEDGAKVARVHLLSQEARKAPEVKLPLYIEELKRLGKIINVNHVNDFITFKISDIYYSRGSYTDSIETLISFFKESQIPVEAEKFHKRIGRSLMGLLAKHLAEGTADDAVRALKKYDELWIKKSKLLSFNFLKGRIYAKVGMHKLAIEYYNNYIKSTSGFKYPDYPEKLVSESVAHLYLARSQKDFGDISSAMNSIKNIKINQLEAPDLNEYHRLERDMSIARDDFEDAIERSKEIKKMSKSDVATLALLYDRAKNHEKAVETIDRYVNDFELTQDERFQILKQKISYLENYKDKEKHKAFLEKFYNEFKDSKNDFDKEKYELVKIYFNDGSLKEANEVRGRISDNSIWSKLASEYSQQADWDQKYKKYIDRVPAMKKERD